jgi:two-component system phosphate regulon sensor histidine kinase PhoR
LKLGVRGKLFIVSLLLMLAVGLSSSLYLERSLQGWLESRIEAEMLRHSRAARDLIEVAAPENTIDAMDPIADRLGGSTQARVSIIAHQGEVLGDSDLSSAQVEAVENHGDRPEVRTALANGHGISRRYSTTIHTHMLYIAVPYQSQAGRGVVRASLPLSEVDLAVGRLRLVLVLAGLVGLGVAVFMSGLASHLATRAIRGLVQHARTVLAGGRRRLPVQSTDEIGGLAGSFNQVVEELDQTVAALRTERDHLETILDGMSGAVLALDDEQRITRVNRAALDLLQISSSTPGQRLRETVRVPALVELASAQSAKASHVTSEFDLPSGRRVLAGAAPLQTTGGCVVVLHDVTEMRRLEAVRRDFVANVSHELRTPITVIRANSETLLDGASEDPDRARTFLDGVHRNAERLSRIIADLLDLARIEAGEHELERMPVDLASLVRRTVENIERQARARRQGVQVEMPEEIRATADPRTLDQILLNLLDNATKYTHEGGHITVRAVELAQGSVRIEVQDDGPGIEPPHRERIFERFYRVDPGRSRDLGGTGLGLSIVKHLVAAMGGTVGFYPASPRGSVFWITLPLAD